MSAIEERISDRHLPKLLRAMLRAGVMQHGLPALQAQWRATGPSLSPVKDALGEVFESCIDVGYYLDGWPLLVGVLLDGHRPGRLWGQFPARGRCPTGRE